MRVAVPMFNNRVSPRFDLAAKLLIANIADGKIIDRQEFSLVNLNSIRRTTLLCNMGVNILICGGISNFAQRLVRGSGIDIISMVQGEVDKVLNLFIKNDLSSVIIPITPGRRCKRRGRGTSGQRTERIRKPKRMEEER